MSLRKLFSLLGLVVIGSMPAAGQQAAGSSPATGQPAADQQPASGAEGSPGDQQPARVSVALSPEEITVGGLVTAEVTLVWMGREPAEPARFPTWQEKWGSAEVLEASEVDGFQDQSGRHIFKQIVQLTAFEVGEVRLPGPKIALPLGDETLELTGEAAGFQVTSVLPEEQPGASGDPNAPPDPTPQTAPDDEAAEPLEPRPSAPPMALVHAQRAFWITSAALGLLWLASLFVMLRRLAAQKDIQRTAPERQVDPLTLLQPLEELFSRLDRVDADYVKPAHTGLSYALRRYLSRRLGFPAVESTTTEIQNHLRPLMLPADMGQRTIQLLRDCDMVKFAGISVREGVTEERVELTRELGRRLEERFRPVTADGQNVREKDADTNGADDKSAGDKGAGDKGADRVQEVRF